MKRSYIAYLRVSTAYQGQTGVSLSEQRLDIECYARAHDLHISRWYTEVCSAATRSRPVFKEVLNALQSESVAGLVIHKIDRGARNLGDWARLGELIDRGVNIHFVRDNLDLQSRGGRLAADIQAVIAADFIRNLREEAKKGIRGRLRQGLWPLPAPLGYKNNGRGQPKTLDPIRAPLVKEAFERYASGAHTLRTLRLEMHRLGLRNVRGGPISITGWSHILKNTFYIGRLELSTGKEVFLGIHPTLVSQKCFLRVQETFGRRRARKEYRHFFLYRGMVNCSQCDHSLVGERQKGLTYYRCHRCPGRCIREEEIDEAVSKGECRWVGSEKRQAVQH